MLIPKAARSLFSALREDFRHKIAETRLKSWTTPPGECKKRTTFAVTEPDRACTQSLDEASVSISSFVKEQRMKARSVLIAVFFLSVVPYSTVAQAPKGWRRATSTGENSRRQNQPAKRGAGRPVCDRRTNSAWPTRCAQGIRT